MTEGCHVFFPKSHVKGLGMSHVIGWFLLLALPILINQFTLDRKCGNQKKKETFWSLRCWFPSSIRLWFHLTLERKIPYTSDSDSASNSIASVDQSLRSSRVGVLWPSCNFRICWQCIVPLLMSGLLFIRNLLLQNDMNRKPLGQIPLDGTCRIARTDGALTFEVRSSFFSTSIAWNSGCGRWITWSWLCSLGFC